MPVISRARRGVAVVLALSLAAIGFTAQSASAAIEGDKTINGYAHDIKVYNALGVLTSGPVSAAGVGCADHAPLYYSVGLTNVSLAGVSLGTSNTTSQASKSGTVQTVTSTFQATGVNMPLLLNYGLKADAITVTSTVTYDTAAQTFTNSSSMNVTNLTVGLPLVPPVISLNGNVSPDSAPINIPGVATIGFHLTNLYGSDAAGLMGKMATGISVQLAGATVSTSIGETYAALYGSTDQNWLFGQGEGLTTRTSDATLAVGPLVTAGVPCSGGGPVTNSLATATILPGTLGSVGAMTSSAQGTRNGLNATVTTSSQVSGVNLAGGQVTADVVGSTSQASTANGGQTVSPAGSSSTFTNLVVAGVPISANTPANTVITLPGLGYVVVNGQTTYASGIETLPLVVHLNPVGATPAVDIVVARSFAFVLGPNTGATTTAATMSLMTSSTLQSAISNELSKGQLAKSGATPKGKALGKFKPRG